MNRLQRVILALSLMPTMVAVAEDVEEYKPKDFTSAVSTTAWLSNQGNVGDYTKTSPLMREQYQTTTANCDGEVLYQDVEVENGTYTLEVYANASYTGGRGFKTQASDGDLGRTIVSANDVRKTIPVEYQVDVTDNKVVRFEGVVVKSGNLRIAMSKNVDGSNWHTIQIKSLLKVSDATTYEGATTEANTYWASVRETILSRAESVKGVERTALVNAETAEEIESAIVPFYEAKPAYDELASIIEQCKEAAAISEGELKEIEDDIATKSGTELGELSETLYKKLVAALAMGEGGDMTSILVNPSFETGTSEGWTYTSSRDSGIKSTSKAPYPMTGSDGAWLFNIWPDGNPITQTIEGLPEGWYKLTAVLSTSGGMKAKLIARDVEEEVSYETIVDGIADPTGIETTVYFRTNGTAEIGAAGVGNWYKVDNFHMYKVDEPYPIAMTSEEKSGWICPNYAESGTAVVVTYNGDKTVKRVTAEVVEGEDHTYELTSENGKTWTLASMPETELEVFVEYYQEGSIAYKTTSVEKTVDDEVFTNELTLTGDGTVSYKTSDEKVATVSETGEVTIVGVGEATITASVENGEEYNYKTKTAKYTVRVSATTKLGETLAEMEEKGEGPWYDMTGAAHTEKPARKGLYIHNGKKTLVR